MPQSNTTRVTSKPKHNLKRPQPRTIYLDGLRGLLSLAVVHSHFPPIVILGYDRILLSSDSIFRTSLSAVTLSSLATNSPGSRHRSVFEIPLVAGCVRRWSIFTMPGLKLLYSGSPAVAMFFCMSGYVASKAWVAFKRQDQDASEITQTQGIGHHGHFHGRAWLSKSPVSVFKRPLRLLLTSALSMIPIFLLTRLDILSSRVPEIHNLVPLDRQYKFGLDNYALLPLRLTSWREQIFDFLRCCRRIVCVFGSKNDVNFNVTYNPVLWTVKYDIRAWLVLLATQGGLVHASRRWTLALLGAMTALGISMGSLEVPLFLGGCLVAEMHDEEESWGAVVHGSELSKTRAFLMTLLVCIGVHLLSYPTWRPSRAPQFVLLHLLNLAPRTWHSLGAIITLYSLRHVAFACRLLEAKPFQSLGRHSFSIYLTHIPVLLALGPHAFERAWKLTGVERTSGIVTGFAIAYSVLMGSVLVVAAGWKICVEESMARCVDWLYKRATTAGSGDDEYDD